METVPQLLIGATALMSIGTLAVLATRSPVRRQRLGELTILMTVVWLCVALIPMARIDIELAARTLNSFQTLQEASPSRTKSHIGVAEGNIDTVASFDLGAPIKQTSDAEVVLIEELVEDASAPDASTSAAASLPGTSGNFVEISKRPIFTSARLFAIWFAGAIGCCVWLIVCRCLLAYCTHRTEPAAAWLRQYYASLIDGRPARLLIRKEKSRPISFGILRPTIILPSHICSDAPSSTLRHVLLHEHAHIQRHDAVGHAMLNLALPLLYIHPLYWVLRSIIEFARELIADDHAAGQEAKSEYVSDLLQLVKSDVNKFHQPIHALAVFRFRNAFARRMNLLMNREQRLESRTTPRFRWITLAIALTLTGGLASISGVRAQLVSADGLVAPETVSGAIPAPQEQVPAVDRTSKPASFESDQNQLPQPKDDDPRGSHFANCVVQGLNLQLSSPTSGFLHSISVKEGDHVKKGQLLATLDNSDVQTQLKLEKARYQQAKRKAENTAGIKSAEKSVEVAKAELDTANEANSKVAGTLSRSEIRRLKLNVDAQLTDVQAERHKLELAKFEAEIALLSLKSLEEQLTRREVISPVNGVVVELNRKAGGWVQRGELLGRLVALDTFHVVGVAPADQFNFGELSGKTVSVRIKRARGESAQVKGTINYVSPEIQADGSFEFRVQCKNQKTDGQWKFLPGMQAVVSVQTASAKVLSEERTRSTAETDTTRPNAMLSKEELHWLNEYVVSLEEIWRAEEARVRSGTSDLSKEVMARLDLTLAKANLAKRLGRIDESVKHYRQAVRTVNSLVETIQAKYEAGEGLLSQVLAAQKSRADVRLQLAEAERIAQSIDASKSAQENEIRRQEIELLTQLVDAREKVWTRVRALHAEGAAGGETAQEATTRSRYYSAKARLAEAMNDVKAAKKHLESAIEAAETAVQAYSAQLDAGTAELDDVLDAQSQLSELKLQLLRLDDGYDTRPRPTAAPPTPVRTLQPNQLRRR